MGSKKKPLRNLLVRRCRFSNEHVQEESRSQPCVDITSRRLGGEGPRVKDTNRIFKSILSQNILKNILETWKEYSRNITTAS